MNDREDGGLPRTTTQPDRAGHASVTGQAWHDIAAHLVRSQDADPGEIVWSAPTTRELHAQHDVGHAYPELLRDDSRAGGRRMVDLPSPDSPMVTALLPYEGFKGNCELQHRIYDEREIQTLLCDDCPSLLLRGGLVKRHWRVAHEAACPAWIRYQKILLGYTAMPSGVIVPCQRATARGHHQAAQQPACNPCGAVVTHRGPYRRPADQAAAEAVAVRTSAGGGGGERA